MRFEDKYRHFKGGEYVFLGIALALGEKNMSLDTVSKMKYEGVVRYHEDNHDLDICTLDGAIFIQADVPHVIYEGKDKQVWAREVDDFFGVKETEYGTWIKRFVKI